MMVPNTKLELSVQIATVSCQITQADPSLSWKQILRFAKYEQTIRKLES